jgi:hypothetical protein
MRAPAEPGRPVLRNEPPAGKDPQPSYSHYERNKTPATI